MNLYHSTDARLWQDNVSKLGAMIVSVPLFFGEEVCFGQAQAILLASMGKATPIHKLAILTALLNFQQQEYDIWTRVSGGATLLWAISCLLISLYGHWAIVTQTGNAQLKQPNR